MSDFIFEIFSEEVPAKMQKAAAENFVKIASEIFAKNNLQFSQDNIQALVMNQNLSKLTALLFLRAKYQKFLPLKLSKILCRRFYKKW